MKVIKGGFNQPRKRKISMRPEDATSPTWSEYHVSAVDDKGHGVRISALIPTPLKKQIQAFISSRAIPDWTTEGDLIRWCVKVGLDRVIEEHERIPDQVMELHAQAHLFIETEKRLYDHMRWRQLLSTLSDAVIQFVNEEEFTAAEAQLSDSRFIIKTLASDYWRPRFEERIGQLEALIRRKKKQAEKRRTRED